jgi:sporulation protein YlmC with PRC-barrel domain
VIGRGILVSRFDPSGGEGMSHLPEPSVWPVVLPVSPPSKETEMPTLTGHTTAIRASRVIGTEVKDSAGEAIGKIEDLILEKTDNAIMFAVVGFGGVLGMGEKFHPVPWSSLDYDEEVGAYVVPFSKEQLKAAPADTIKELTKNDGTFMRDKSYDYYKAEPYWH